MAYDMFVQDLNGLTNEQIRQHCPAVFAERAYEGVSTRYAYLSTSKPLDRLRVQGFVPTMAMQARTRKEGERDYTKHLLRFSLMEDILNRRDDRIEVVLVNSHNRGSGYIIYIGILRTVCKNGLIAGDIDEFHVRHQGDIASQVVEGTLRIVEEGEQVMADVGVMKQIDLSDHERTLLAQYALAARFDRKVPDNGDMELALAGLPYTPGEALRPLRDADKPKTLYNTLNVLQEKLLRGGMQGTDDEGNDKKSRKVNGIGQNIELNRTLWLFAQALKREKLA